MKVPSVISVVKLTSTAHDIQFCDIAQESSVATAYHLVVNINRCCIFSTKVLYKDEIVND